MKSISIDEATDYLKWSAAHGIKAQAGVYTAWSSYRSTNQPPRRPKV